MKYLKNITLVALATLLTTTAIAQKNVVRLGLGGLAARNLNFDVERAVTDNQALSLNLGILVPRSKLPFGVDDGTDLELNRLGGISIAPEYRFYTGTKKALNGFYVAPYLKYSSYGVGASGNYDGSDGDISAKLSTIGGGIQLGAQWLINDHFSIDWSFFGIGINRHTISVRFESNDPDVDFQGIEDDIEAELADTPDFVRNSINTESGSDYVSTKAPFFFPALRSSLSIGYAF